MKPDEIVMIFPLVNKTKSFLSGCARFASDRDSGKRKHAGCDLYGNLGDTVKSMTSGKVLNVSLFYKGTYQVVIQSSSMIFRYCEIIPDKLIKVGSQVSAGQIIGSLGKMEGINQCMLHLETYFDYTNTKEDLTQVVNAPFKRRYDLYDFTEILKKMVV